MLHILIVANPEQIKAKIKEKNKDISDEDLEVQTQQQMNAKLEKAKKLQAQVKRAPSTFAKVAKENSQDPGSALNGGDLGFFAKEEMVEQFSDVATRNIRLFDGSVVDDEEYVKIEPRECIKIEQPKLKSTFLSGPISLLTLIAFIKILSLFSTKL